VAYIIYIYCPEIYYGGAGVKVSPWKINKFVAACIILQSYI